MSLLRILAKKNASLTSANHQPSTLSSNSTPNIEPPSLFPSQAESSNITLALCLLSALGCFIS